MLRTGTLLPDSRREQKETKREVFAVGARRRHYRPNRMIQAHAGPRWSTAQSGFGRRRGNPAGGKAASNQSIETGPVPNGQAPPVKTASTDARKGTQP
jgi:hypothetical protein